MSETTIQTVGHQRRLPITLRDVAMPVFRHRRLALLIFAGVFGGALLSLLLAPRKYEAEMKILVNRDRVDAAVTPGANSEAAVAPTPAVSELDLNSEVELIRSRDLLEQVVLARDLQSQPVSTWVRVTGYIADALRGTRTTPRTRLARTVESLDDHLVVEPLKKTTMIRVAYTSRDPELSAQVLTTLATLYQEKHAAVHRPAGTFNFFDQQANRYQAELAAAEAQLVDFDSRDGGVAPAEQRGLVLQQLAQFDAAVQQAQANAFAAEERARALRAQAAAASQRQTTQIRKSENTELLAGIQNTLLALELKRSDMLTKYAPSYPPVQELETQIEQTRKAIAQAQQSPVEEVTTDRVPTQDWVATELAKADADRAQFQAQASATARIARHYKETSEELDREAAAHDDLERNVKAAEDNYLLYVHKREEARISDALDSKRIVNISIAEAPTVPALPNLQLGWLVISGFFAASILSVGAAYAADRLNPSFRTADELGRYLDMKVLASIPASTEEVRP